jgi:hypothetical protein
MTDIIIIDSVDKAIDYIQSQLTQAQSDLSDITSKYEDGGMYSNDDASDETYYEGKVTGLEWALWAVKQVKENT